MTSESSLRIVVMGYIVRGPLGGMAWSDLQYLDSLQAAGHNVFYVEDSDDYPSCYDPRSDATTTDPSYGLSFAAAELERIGFGDRWAFYDAHRSVWHGPLARLGPGIFSEADVLLNLAGVNPLREWAGEVRSRVFVDQDPGFTQIRNLTDVSYAQRVSAHNAFATFAANTHRDECTVPDDGVDWKPTRQPVIADHFVAAPLPAGRRFTTVMQWESYPASEYEGRSYGMKSASFEPLKELPDRVDAELELAVGAPGPVKEDLAARQWHIVDPRVPTTDTITYADYIRRSTAELGIAKHGYVITRSGWFSERSLTYMVLGRPVVAQDTGFGEWLPIDEGVLAYTTADEAVDSIERVLAAPATHARAARELAIEHFDGTQVVTELLELAHAPTGNG